MKNSFLLMFICFCAASALYAQSDNPYALFGHEEQMLRTPQERQRFMLIIPNPDTTSEVAKLGISAQDGIVFFFDKLNNLIGERELSQEDMARFLSIDPLTRDYPELTPFQFASNTPIMAIDLDGLEAKVVITDKVSGYTVQRVAGRVWSGKPYIPVPTYKAYLIDAQKPSKIVASIDVTRDAWYSRGELQDGRFELTNRAFEPTDKNVNLYAGLGFEYPPSTNLPALALRQKGVQELKAEPFSIEQNTYLDGSLINDARTDLGVAKGVMFHIGGFYIKTPGRETGVAASYGCFGAVCSKQVFSKGTHAQGLIDNDSFEDNGDASNKEYVNFYKKIQQVQSQSKDKRILISITKRNKYEKSDKIDP